MFIMAWLFESLALLFDMIFSVLYFLLVVRVILSWFQVNPYHEIVQAVFRITEPILQPFRRLPLRIGLFDLSPVLAFFALYIARNLVVGEVLTRLAQQFR